MSRSPARRIAVAAASLAVIGLVLGGGSALADPGETTPSSTGTTTTAPAPETTPTLTPTSTNSASSGPARGAAPTATGTPFVEAEMAFGAPSYSVADLMTMTLTVHNPTDVTVEHVFVAWTGPDVALRGAGFGTIEQHSVDLAPGETVTATATGYDVGVGEGELSFRVNITWGGPDNAVSVDADATTRITPATGDYSGAVYTDDNGNGAFDDGEGLGGVQVSAYGGAPRAQHDTTTAADGTFSFTNLPGGQYTASFQAPGGWVVPGPDNHGGDDVIVGGAEQTTDLEYAAARPLKESLHLVAAFDQRSYHVGDTATLVLTLSNSGTKRIAGITANCDRSGLASTSWDGIPPPGDLGGRTWDLSPGQSVTIRVPGEVLTGALRLGKISAECDFGNSGYLVDGNPSARASAKVVKAGHAGGAGDGGDTPAAQGSSAPDGLAYTGMNMYVPLFGGLVLLAAGAALVFATRWRRLENLHRT